MEKNTKQVIIVPSEALPVIDEAEVVVAGGGTSGFIAAAAAARAGAKTILLERFGYLGGCTTAPYNTSISKFYDSDGNRIIDGLAGEFIDRMKKEGECFMPADLAAFAGAPFEMTDTDENAYIAAQSHLGVRETRRIVGDYMLSLNDLQNEARFDDVIALNCRPLDYHLKGSVFKIEMLKGHHDIPLRCLIPQKAENLLVVGRCISVDHEAQASLRGAATCMATGHAGGCAAALAASGNGRVRDLDIRAVQNTLRAQGAILSAGT